MKKTEMINKQLSLGKHTIQAYKKKGIIGLPDRINEGGNNHAYNETSFRKIFEARMFQNVGIKLEDLKNYLDLPKEEKSIKFNEIADEKILELENQIINIERSKLLFENENVLLFMSDFLYDSEQNFKYFNEISSLLLEVAIKYDEELVEYIENKKLKLYSDEVYEIFNRPRKKLYEEYLKGKDISEDLIKFEFRKLEYDLFGPLDYVHLNCIYYYLLYFMRNDEEYWSKDDISYSENFKSFYLKKFKNYFEENIKKKNISNQTLIFQYFLYYFRNGYKTDSKEVISLLNEITESYFVDIMFSPEIGMRLLRIYLKFIRNEEYLKRRISSEEEIYADEILKLYLYGADCLEYFINLRLSEERFQPMKKLFDDLDRKAEELYG